MQVEGRAVQERNALRTVHARFRDDRSLADNEPVFEMLRVVGSQIHFVEKRCSSISHTAARETGREFWWRPSTGHRWSDLSPGISARRDRRDLLSNIDEFLLRVPVLRFSCAKKADAVRGVYEASRCLASDEYTRLMTAYRGCLGRPLS
jgi:hypothetical protein